MLALDRSTAIVVMALLGMIAIPMAFAYSRPHVPDASTTAAFVLLIEVGIYFAATLVTNARISLLLAVGLSLGLMITRVFLCLVAFILAGILREVPQSMQNTIFDLLGNPLAALFHIVFVLVAAIHVIDSVLPGSFSEETSRKIGTTGVTQPAAPTLTEIRQTVHASASPTGGFIHVFTFEELSAVIRKSQGLEGFVIASGEGLPVWRDLPPRINAEILTAQLAAAGQRAGDALSASGFPRSTALLVESREYLVYASPLDANFALILVFNTRVPAAECFARTAIVARTAREFLNSKYPILPPMKSASAA
jgi:predicted regulator of Ras-like GTPase activity (Roadblock/LC7/MglB family)